MGTAIVLLCVIALCVGIIFHLIKGKKGGKGGCSGNCGGCPGCR